MRICILSERMVPPFDEGIKNYAWQLVQGLAKYHDVLALTAMAHDVPELGIENVAADKLLLSPRLLRRFRAFRPELVLYVPTACATLFSFVRTRVLKALAGGVPTVLIALQPRQYGPLSRTLMPRLQPDLLLVQSESTRAPLQRIGCRAAALPPGVDTHRFRPVDPSERRRLRLRFGFPEDAFIVLHVGHLNRGRNVQALARVQQEMPLPHTQVVVVGSTSTPHDAGLVAELSGAGVRVIGDYVADIAQLYQLSDCYVFPVSSETSSIDVPLSVLEAMACSLRVVTTRFGGLDSLFSSGPGLNYVQDADEIPAGVRACASQPSKTREMVAPYDWSLTAARLLEVIAANGLLADSGTAQADLSRGQRRA